MNPDEFHILVVDDSADAADSMVELLSIWGYDSRACYSGSSALSSAFARRPTIVLLDIAMPRMDGFRFAVLFRRLPCCEKVPIIAHSGYSGESYLARARETGIQHYLLKPTDPGRLRELLAWVVAPAANWLQAANRLQKNRTDKRSSSEETPIGPSNASKRGTMSRLHRLRSAARKTASRFGPRSS
jgi:CheY-like chemotaxis protein